MTVDSSGRPISESYWVIPGRLLAGEYPGSFDPETARCRLDAFLEAGFDTFIDLTQPYELEPYEQILRRQAAHGLTADHLRFPIPDRGIPTPDGMSAILDAIDEALAAGKRVYVHCWGGVGRTGLTVGCYLRRHGRTGRAALDQLAKWWRHVPKRVLHSRSPETDEQVQFILNWRK